MNRLRVTAKVRVRVTVRLGYTTLGLFLFMVIVRERVMLG